MSTGDGQRPEAMDVDGWMDDTQHRLNSGCNLFGRGICGMCDVQNPFARTGKMSKYLLNAYNLRKFSVCVSHVSFCVSYNHLGAIPSMTHKP